MSADWQTYSLGDLGDIKTGKTPPSSISNAYGGSTPFITPKDMDGRKWIDSTERCLSQAGLASVKNCLVPKNTVAVSCIGSDMGKAVLLTKESVTNQQINTIILDQERFNPEFVYYDLSLRQQEIKGMASGSATPILNKGHFSKLEIKLPDKETQDEIVRNLRSLDDKIELNRQINQTLEQIAQTIFKSWFVDFEPVKAKIEAKAAGRDPERAAMCAISGKLEPELDQLPPEQRQQLAATAALFPDELVESELGLIPVGWNLSSIGNEVEVVGGGTPSTKNPEYWENGTYHWTTPRDLSGVTEKILASTERRITKEGLARISSGLLPIDTVLMSSRAPVGYLALAKVPVAVNQGFIAMKCTDRLPPTYVLQWSNSVMDEIKQRASGTTFAEISKKNFRLIRVVVPNAEILEKYDETAAVLYSQISGTLSEIKALSEIRDTLLPELLSGQIEL